MRLGAGYWCRCRVPLQGAAQGAAVRVVCAPWRWHLSDPQELSQTSGTKWYLKVSLTYIIIYIIYIYVHFQGYRSHFQTLHVLLVTSLDSHKTPMEIPSSRWPRKSRQVFGQEDSSTICSIWRRSVLGSILCCSQLKISDQR